MGAVKAWMHETTEKHPYYELLDKEERFTYKSAVLSCAARLLKEIDEYDGNWDKQSAVIECINVLHELHDELDVVDNWSPAESRFKRFNLV